jgi:hypothetical protein
VIWFLRSILLTKLSHTISFFLVNSLLFLSRAAPRGVWSVAQAVDCCVGSKRTAGQAEAVVHSVHVAKSRGYISPAREHGGYRLCMHCTQTLCTVLIHYARYSYTMHCTHTLYTHYILVLPHGAAEETKAGTAPRSCDPAGVEGGARTDSECVWGRGPTEFRRRLRQAQGSRGIWPGTSHGTAGPGSGRWEGQAHEREGGALVEEGRQRWTRCPASRCGVLAVVSRSRTSHCRRERGLANGSRTGPGCSWYSV